ncbi:uncharacterized protein LOC111056978 isoform X2 [Nilaparvata lugens]|uniref:uncharacterized protein LOC111056978 isoform X2 n=1 Tax=Nilaparvata lugens TaxID=108931 RepID=UPI00193CAE10|nr:uncharacterized protein LOC111056978 isoform X2 [Nilaparvata lugens]
MSRGTSKPMSDEEEDSDSNSSIESLSSSSWKIEPKVETLKPSSCSPKVIDFSDSSSECSDGTYEAKVLSYLNGISIQENSKTEEKSLSTSKIEPCSPKVIDFSDSSSECSDGTYEAKVLSYLNGISIQQNSKAEEKSLFTSKIEVDISSSSWESDSSLEPSFRYSSRTLVKKKIWETLEKSMEKDNKMRRVKKLKKKRKLQVESPTPEPVPTEIYPDAGLRRNLILKQIQIAHLSKRQLKRGDISEENHLKPEELGLQPGFSEELGLKPGFSEELCLKPVFSKELGLEPRFIEEPEFQSRFKKGLDLKPRFDEKQGLESSINKCNLVSSFDGRNDIESSHGDKPVVESSRKNLESSIEEWFCEVCNLDFETNPQLNTHMVNKHEGLVNFLCQNCGHPFYEATLYNSHFQKEHNNKTTLVSCYLCGGGEFPDFVTLLEHLKTSHVTTDLYQERCSECGGVFISREVFDRHCEKLKMCHQYLMGCFSEKAGVKFGGENAEGGTPDRTKFEGGNDVSVVSRTYLEGENDNCRLRDDDGSIVNGTDLERGRIIVD